MLFRSSERSPPRAEVSYTRAPAWVKMTDDANDLTANIWSLARLTFPEQRPHDIGHPVPSEEHHVSLDPDDHLLCFDYLYYTAVAPGVGLCCTTLE